MYAIRSYYDEVVGQLQLTAREGLLGARPIGGEVEPQRVRLMLVLDDLSYNFV